MERIDLPYKVKGLADVTFVSIDGDEEEKTVTLRAPEPAVLSGAHGKKRAVEEAAKAGMHSPAFSRGGNPYPVNEDGTRFVGEAGSGSTPAAWQIEHYIIRSR